MKLSGTIVLAVLVWAFAGRFCAGGPKPARVQAKADSPAAKAPAQPAQSAKKVLATLRKAHPRLILTEERLAELKKLAAEDPVLAKFVQSALASADKAARRPPLVYKKVGPRLLSVSRDCLRRTYALGLAWRWTHQESYARAARDNLLTVSAFGDWNPSHFLDTAEMSHAVGIGYDWLHDWLDEASRRKIRAGLVKLGLTPGLASYTGKASYGWWVRATHNWNQVCNGGMIVGALAVAETDAELAEQIVSSALQSLPRALATYAPDGAWPEGPGYWHYATSYTAFGLAALDSALGTDFGHSKAKGLDVTALFPIYLAGPTDRFFAFADSGSSSRPMPCQFWLARRFDLPIVAQVEHELIRRYGSDPLHVIWYVPAPKAAPPLPPCRLFRGPVEVAVFRSAWNDSTALFVGTKAGTNRANHAHLDLGSFELDALGVRWAVDLGGDDYNLPGYWDTRKGGRRWNLYRLGSLSHNVPLLDNHNQDPTAAAKVLRFNAAEIAPRVVIDLSAAYKPQAQSALRGIMMFSSPQGHGVLVQDELQIDEPCQVAWGMATQAEISVPSRNGQAVTDGTEYRLKQDGKELMARVLSPAGAAFTAESAEQEPPQRTNKGVRRLMLRLEGRKGAVRVAVLLTPVPADGRPAEPPKLQPLKDW